MTLKNHKVICKNGRRRKERRKQYMLTITLFISKSYKCLKILLMSRIFTINDIEIKFYVYKNKSKHPRGSSSSFSILMTHI